MGTPINHTLMKKNNKGIKLKKTAFFKIKIDKFSNKKKKENKKWCSNNKTPMSKKEILA